VRRAVIRHSIAPTSTKDRKHKTHKRHRHAHHTADEPRTRTKHHARHHGGGKEEMKVVRRDRLSCSKMLAYSEEMKDV
jgi:hypothetical protein